MVMINPEVKIIRTLVFTKQPRKVDKTVETTKTKEWSA